MKRAEYLVFETGGTKLIVGVAGEDCRLIETKVLHRTSEDQAQQSLEKLIEAAREFRKHYELQGSSFRAIGFGFGGTVRRSTRELHLCLHENGWDGLPVVQILEQEFGLPVIIENDCKVAALAESHFGAGKGFRTVFYITVGTGVGGGIVRDGRIQIFNDIGEAEIGHVVVAPQGPMCPCGGRGCVEAVCSGPGISRLAKWIAEQDPAAWKSSNISKDRSSPRMISSEEIMRQWRRGDLFAATVVDRAAGYLSQGLATVINLLSPDVIVVGGGVGAGNYDFLQKVSKKTDSQVVSYFRDQYRIVPSQLGEQVVSQGAAILAAQSFD
jgi:glucokinase